MNRITLQLLLLLLLNDIKITEKNMKNTKDTISTINNFAIGTSLIALVPFVLMGYGFPLALPVFCIISCNMCVVYANDLNIQLSANLINEKKLKLKQLNSD